MMNEYFKNTRYADACLSQIGFDEGCLNKIYAWLQKPKNVLFIHSSPGIGKTYLCSAIVNHFTEKKTPVYYLEEKKLFEKLSAWMEEGKSALTHFAALLDNDFFIYDDMFSQKQISGEWQYQVHFSFLDERLKTGLPTIITSNLSPEEITRIYHERFISRLEAQDNTIVEIFGPDMRRI